MPKNYINEMTQNVVVKQKAAFSWSFILVFAGPFLAAMILSILELTGVTQPSNWVNWVMAVIFIPLILLSLIVAQRRELIGAYGETILLLIPTFVWLLPGHDQAKKTMIIISFVIVIVGAISFFAASLIRFLKTPDTEEGVAKRRKIVEALIRGSFVAAAVTSTLIVSIVLINWGDFSLKLAPITDVKAGTKDYADKAWILFIAIVTILVALTLVLLGLISGAKKKIETSLEDKSFALSRKRVKKVNRKKVASKTTFINVNPKNKKPKKPNKKK